MGCRIGTFILLQALSLSSPYPDVLPRLDRSRPGPAKAERLHFGVERLRKKPGAARGRVHRVEMASMTFRTILSFIFLILLLLVAALSLSEDTAIVDFIQYWAAGKLFIEGGNPYDAASMASLEHPLWGANHFPILLWNPPPVFTFIAPLGLFSYANARFIWLLLNGAILLFAVMGELRQPDIRVWRPLVFFYLVTFYPALLSLHDGQVSPLLLLGVSMYLYFERRAKLSAEGRIDGGYASGFGLSLTILKPHLLFLFYTRFFIESLFNKPWRPLLGFLGGAVFLLIFPFCFRADIYDLYGAALTAPPIYWKTPTIGSFLQGMTGSDTMLVRFMPTFVAVAFGITIFTFRRVPFGFSEALVKLIPLSLLFSPYGWVFDQILLLPVAFVVARKLPQNFLILIGANLIAALVPRDAGAHTLIWYPVVYLLALHDFRAFRKVEAK